MILTEAQKKQSADEMERQRKVDEDMAKGEEQRLKEAGMLDDEAYMADDHY